MSSEASYKKRKEDFVSNLSGGTVAEINYVTAVAPVAILLWSILQQRQSFFKEPSLLAYAVDYGLNVGAILLAVTLYSSQPLLLHILLLAPAVLIAALPRASPAKKKATVQAQARIKANANKGRPNYLPLKPFLTHYRACMMVVTCIAILAVDFPLFPRRFAKVETWGTSLMDVGVGAFVFSSGIVAARPLLKEQVTGSAASTIQKVVASTRHSIPLLILGVVRLLSVKGLDYAEHVTEYGVHWNFFFTLGFLPPFVAASQGLLRMIPSHVMLALLISALYEVLLESTGLKAFILTAPRVDLISRNREGIFSFMGYLAIFLAGQGLGMILIPRRLPGISEKGHSHTAQDKAMLKRILTQGALWVGLYYFATHHSYGLGLTVSRRMANLSYVLWVAAFNHVQVLLFYLADWFFFPEFYQASDAQAEKEAYSFATSRVLRAFNRNGLAVFLLANVLTGIVNMTVRTLDATPVITIGILVAYSFAVTLVAVLLDYWNMSIKL